MKMSYEKQYGLLENLLKVRSTPGKVHLDNITDIPASGFWFDTKEDVDKLINWLKVARDTSFGKDDSNSISCPDCGATLEVNLQFIKHAS